MGIPCTGCVSHTVYLKYENSNSEVRGESDKNNGKRLLRNMKEKKVGTKEKSSKHGL